MAAFRHILLANVISCENNGNFSPYPLTLFMLKRFLYFVIIRSETASLLCSNK